MATVPFFTRRVSERGIPNAYLDAPRLDTTSVPNALGNVANLAQNIMVQEINRENETRVKEADITYQTRVRSLLENPESGFYTRKGGAAVDSHAGTMQQLDNIYNEVLESTQNPVQRQMLANVLDRRNLQNQTNINRHTVNEKRKWETATAEARAANSISDAVSNRYDDSALQLALNTGLDEMDQLGELKGMPPEEVKRQKEIYTTELHKSVINAHLEQGDVVAAKKHFDKFKTTAKGERRQIRAEEVAGISKAIKAYEQRAVSQLETDKIMTGISDPSKQLEAARKIKDPETRDEVVQRVKLRQAEQKQLQRDRELDQAKNTWDKIIQFPSMDSIPVNTPPDQKLKMRQYITNRINGKDIITDQQLDYALNLMAADEPEKFAQINMYDHIDELNPTDFDRHVQRQVQIRSSIRSGKDFGDDFYSLRSDLQEANDVLKSMGIKTNAKPGTAHAEQTAAYYKAFTNEVRRFQIENGKEPNALEKEQIRNDIAFKVIEKSSFFGIDTSDEIPAFMAEVEGVPQAAVPYLVNRLREADPSAEITLQDIQSLYQAMVRRQLENQ